MIVTKTVMAHWSLSIPLPLIALPLAVTDIHRPALCHWHGSLLNLPLSGEHNHESQ